MRPSTDSPWQAMGLGEEPRWFQEGGTLAEQIAGDVLGGGGRTTTRRPASAPSRIRSVGTFRDLKDVEALLAAAAVPGTRAVVIGGGLATLLSLWGGVTIILAGGNPEKINEGKEIITSAISGILFIVKTLLLNTASTPFIFDTLM